MSQDYTTRTSCRVCNAKSPIPLFSLGDHYVNGFLKPGDPLPPKVPIELELCRLCSLVQAKHTAPQELLYAGTYWYRSGVTETMREALLDVVRDAVEVARPNAGDVVLDIGSNDGTLLRHYPGWLYKVGVEPATNLAQSGGVGVDTFISDFWSHKSYRNKVGRAAKIITAIGMFYDLEDPNEFIMDVACSLQRDGLFIAQLMCLKNMININDVGNFAHEHLEFYSIQSLKHLFYKHGLEIIDITKNNINGESYRIFARLIDGTVQPRFGAKERLRQVESDDAGLSNPEFYQVFFQELERNKESVVNFIGEEIAKGKTVWVYGASTKGNTILQYYDLDNTLITAAADRSPEKWGRVTVGTNIPIVSEAEARTATPDYFLVLPYAFLDEFIEREKNEVWRKQGGKFIVPLPELRIV
jgi:NDP-4-keto-2,6-dideoxyhexose 3-C-methyltransferase